MAPSADPTGNPSNGSGDGAAAAGNPSNGSVGNSGPAQALKHDPGLAVEWSAEEQAILDEGLTKYASEPIVVRYATIAKQLQDKTVRDVALRCRWMTKKESGKRRKDDLTRKNKDKKDRVTDPSAKQPAHLAGQPSVPTYALPMLEVDTDDDISYKAIGGVTGQLLEHNAQVFNQISANFANCQIQENISLLCQTRDNILKILNEIILQLFPHWYQNTSMHSANDMPEIMKHMPPLPVKVSEELANSILPRMAMPMQT